MTNTELLALLREARDSVALDAETAGNSRFASEDERVSGLLARIDAALAAHDAVPPSEEKVEWKLIDIDYPMHHANCEGAELVVFPNLFPANDAESLWRWKVGRQGYTNDFDEAQRAALAAARGMR